jgi:hypothetical protein
VLWLAALSACNAGNRRQPEPRPEPVDGGMPSTDAPSENARDGASEGLGCGDGQVMTNVGCTACNTLLESYATQRATLLANSQALACQTAADCLQMPVESVCGSGCPIAVNRTESAAFAQTLKAVGARLCDHPGFATACGTSEVACPDVDVDCVNNSCALVAPPTSESECELARWRFDSMRTCFAEAPPASVECGFLRVDSAMTQAVDSSGQCWSFPSSTLPAGYTPAPSEHDCQRTQDLCAEGCTWTARRFDEYQGCFGPALRTGTRDCNQRLVHTDPILALDSSGGCWSFDSLPLPASYSEVGSPSVLTTPFSCNLERPVCDKISASTCQTDEVLEGAECMSCSTARVSAERALAELAVAFDTEESQTCNTDADCTASWKELGCVEGCAIPINNAAYGAFTAARSRLNRQWCEDPNWEDQCAGQRIDCAGVVPRCFGGHCALLNEAEATTACDASLCPGDMPRPCGDAGMAPPRCTAGDGGICADSAACAPPEAEATDAQPARHPDACADAGDRAACL